MNREAEIQVMAAVIILLQDASDQEIHDPDMVVVRRRTLGFIADTFRKAGVDVHAPNIGELADPDKGEG